MNIQTKWADYVIVAVRYQQTTFSDSIERVRVFTDDGTALINPDELSKYQVVLKLKNGYTFVTAYQENHSNQWKCGEDVRLVKHPLGDYLRTDSNRIAADNLGNLPRF
ncbi:MAG: hypothetical protein OHK0046_33140 [Anaerolineae bacterium]